VRCTRSYTARGVDDELWLPPLSAARPGRRRPRTGPPPLTREQIVTAAITIADSEGPDAISMRRIARDLDVGNMSIYWYVAGRDELLALMIDAVEGEFEIPSPSGDWKADVAATARNIRSVLIRHGWMATVIGFRRSVGPNEVVHLENSLATLTGPPLHLDLEAALHILMAIETYVLGFALRDQQELRIERQGASRVGDGAADDDVARYVDRLDLSRRYPKSRSPDVPTSENPRCSTTWWGRAGCSSATSPGPRGMRSTRS